MPLRRAAADLTPRGRSMHDERLRRYLLSRRQVLQRGVAGMSGAALASLPLVGCGGDDRGPSGAVPDAGPDGGGAVDTSAPSDADGVRDTGPGDVGDVQPDGGVPDTDGPPPARFRFAIVADSHIIDPFYDGRESNQLDTESLQFAESRLRSAFEVMNRLDPKPEFVIHVGDVIHNYPSNEFDFFFENRTRLDIMADLQATLEMPLYAAYGNHDYRIGQVTRAFTEELFEIKLGMQRYVSVDHAGWKFIVLNNFLGATNEEGHEKYNPSIGSFGEEQLQWLEAQLEEGMPTFVFLHYAIGLCDAFEFADLSLPSLLMRYRDTIRYVIAGHTHRWLELGDQFGPPHMIMGATRYDEDCYIVVDVNIAEGSYTFANRDQWGMFSLYSEPFEG